MCDLLIERFGVDRPLESIKLRDAEEWVTWLAAEGSKRDSENTKLEGNTVRRRTGTARQIFATAISWELLTKNPFVGKKMSTTVLANEARKKFVSWENVQKVIQVAPNAEWKALIAFVRLVGPRVPSELVGLTWADIDFVSKKIVIKSPKTKQHGGEHTMRSCPLFPELVSYLQALAETVGPGVDVPLSTPVFPIAVDPGVNLRTALARLIVLAGLTPWEKLFVNLRSSRETELLDVFPITDVCRWFGHSPQVAVKFYTQARTEVADRASSERTLSPAGAQVGDVGGEMGAHMGYINTHQENSVPHRDSVFAHENEGDLMVSKCLSNATDGSTSGRYWTRTNDPHDVNVVL